jgi:hypothetical protein
MKDIVMLNYLNRKDILNKYPICNTTYNKILKKLDNHPHDNLLSFISDNKRYIHESICDKYFFLDRLPNLNQPTQVKKWLDLVRWDYFCCITPTSNLMGRNEQLIKQINKVIKREFKIDKSVLYYSLEPYKDSEYFHIHFVLHLNVSIPVEEITKIIRKNLLVGEDVIKRNRYSNPIDIQKYEKDKFGLKGLNYVAKLNLMTGILK